MRRLYIPPALLRVLALGENFWPDSVIYSSFCLHTFQTGLVILALDDLLTQQCVDPCRDVPLHKV